MAAPGITLAASLVQQSPSAHDTTSELASIASSPGRAELSAALGFAALVLMVPALFGLARPLWSDRPRWALTGLSLGVVGVMALTALMGSAPVTVAMVAGSADRAEMVALTDRYEGAALTTVWVLLMLLGYLLGPIVLGVAWWRQSGQWLVPAALLAGLVVQMADAGRWPLAAGYALTWLGLAAAGARLWSGFVDRPLDPERRADRLEGEPVDTQAGG
jgi:hypothetical protein